MIKSDFPYTPITEETFERQGWEMMVEREGGDYDEGEEYYYFFLNSISSICIFVLAKLYFL